ncbi:MAG: UDP-2,3-diacylglucosamine diphosphatase [Muribaculaceae bacterium]|nr:UDP-2,3-diacylglucosamine diphosphatase [Muribaculaceae bacterium]
MRNKAYFLSDLHLGATYIEDTRESERRVVRFLDSIARDAAEIYLLGDILDYWYEYRYVVPRGYVRFFGKLAELSDAGVKITWIIGNHDIWIFDYIPTELGVKVVDGVLDCTVLDKLRVVMAHGDGIWKSDLLFPIIRGIFRNRFCQKLYASIHPRWTVPFAYRWSNHSRWQGEEELRRREREREEMKRRREGLPENIRQLVTFCNNYTDSLLRAGETDLPKYYLFGHLHEVVEERLEHGAEMLVIGDWLVKFSYAVFDGQSLKLEYYKE